MGFETAVQTAIYQRLKNDAALGSLVSGIYDSVPGTAVMPYVTVGEDVHTAWDTYDTVGSMVSITIHVWADSSGGRGRKQVKDIQGAIYNALHRARITGTEFKFVSITFENSQTFMDEDGRAWHGVQTFQLLLDKR